jgi:hypothetical protein
MKHKIKVYRWVHGKLECEELISGTFKEAEDAIKHLIFHTAKIFDELEQLVAEFVGEEFITYA